VPYIQSWSTKRDSPPVVYCSARQPLPSALDVTSITSFCSRAAFSRFSFPFPVLFDGDVPPSSAPAVLCRPSSALLLSGEAYYGLPPSDKRPCASDTLSPPVSCTTGIAPRLSLVVTRTTLAFVARPIPMGLTSTRCPSRPASKPLLTRSVTSQSSLYILSFVRLCTNLIRSGLVHLYISKAAADSPAHKF
jgi:hypothetical protein